MEVGQGGGKAATRNMRRDSRQVGGIKTRQHWGVGGRVDRRLTVIRG